MARTPRPRTTIRGIKAANQAIGHHWLDNDTMKFHGTVIVSGVTVAFGESYFYARSQWIDPRDSANDGPIMYTIQHACHSGEIHTVGRDHCDGGYPSADAAHAAFYDAIKQDRYCKGWDGKFEEGMA